MRNRCCPTYRWPCYFGNTEQTYTKECESGRYWKNQGPVTETTLANTIYHPTCQATANALAEELAQYSAEEQLQCETCCFDAVCVFLVNPTDVQYLAYWTNQDGILFTEDVEICVNYVSACGGFGIPRVTFQAETEPFETLSLDAIGECGTLRGGALYNWGIGFFADANIVPDAYTIGMDCNIECPPWIGVDEEGFTTGGIHVITSFPALIAKCVG